MLTRLKFSFMVQTHRVWIPGRIFFVPGNRESKNVIPGIPGHPGMAFTVVLLAQWRYEKP